MENSKCSSYVHLSLRWWMWYFTESLKYFFWQWNKFLWNPYGIHPYDGSNSNLTSLTEKIIPTSFFHMLNIPRIKHFKECLWRIVNYSALCWSLKILTCYEFINIWICLHLISLLDSYYGQMKNPYQLSTSISLCCKWAQHERGYLKKINPKK